MAKHRRSPTANEALYGGQSVPRNAPGVPTNRIGVLRVRSRLTIGELAKLLDFTSGTVSKHERGLKNLTAYDIMAYAKVFKCPSYEIFTEPPLPTSDWDDSRDSPP